MAIELDAPNVGALEKKYLGKVIDSGFVSTFGPFVVEFEKKMAAYLGVPAAVATQSGTSALHMALVEAGIGSGDEVIVPVMTFSATVNPVLYVGAKPVFVDCDLKSWNLNADAIEEKITSKTRAIMPVHLYGNPCAMEKIGALAEKFNLVVIEDATESLGATIYNRLTGTFGNFGCFSFNGNKTITTGGGGLVVSKRAEPVNHIRHLINQAKGDAAHIPFGEIGFNYRMTNLEAGLGLAQLERISEFHQTKKRHHAIYRELLQASDGFIFQEEEAGSQSSWWMNAVRFAEGISVSEIEQELRTQGVPTRRVFCPLVQYAPYALYGRIEDFPVAAKIYESALCLPSSTLNSDEDIKAVAIKIREVVHQCVKN